MDNSLNPHLINAADALQVTSDLLLSCEDLHLVNRVNFAGLLQLINDEFERGIVQISS